MAVLGLRCYVGFSLVAASNYCLVVHRLLTAVASLVVEHWLQNKGSTVVSQGLSYSESMWDLPRPGFKPMSPAWAGGFLPLSQQGGPLHILFYTKNILVPKDVNVHYLLYPICQSSEVVAILF